MGDMTRLFIFLILSWQFLACVPSDIRDLSDTENQAINDAMRWMENHIDWLERGMGSLIDIDRMVQGVLSANYKASDEPYDAFNEEDEAVAAAIWVPLDLVVIYSDHWIWEFVILEDYERRRHGWYMCEDNNDYNASRSWTLELLCHESAHRFFIDHDIVYEIGYACQDVWREFNQRHWNSCTS